MRSTVLVVFACVAAIVMVNFLAVPGFWITLYGAAADPQAVFLYRLIGALFGGLAILAWNARSAGRTETDSLAAGLMATNGLLTAVAAAGAISGVYNQFAWGPVAMFGLLTLAFGIARPSRSARPA